MLQLIIIRITDKIVNSVPRQFFINSKGEASNPKTKEISFQELLRYNIDENGTFD